MNKREARRITRELTPAENQRLQNHREQIAEETPDLEMRDQMRKDARDETTLSGELRRAIHASEMSLLEISGHVGVTPIVLDDFLTGERTLRSDVMDRLVGFLGYQIAKERLRNTLSVHSAQDSYGASMPAVGQNRQVQP